MHKLCIYTHNDHEYNSKNNMILLFNLPQKIGQQSYENVDC